MKPLDEIIASLRAIQKTEGNVFLELEEEIIEIGKYVDVLNGVKGVLNEIILLPNYNHSRHKSAGHIKENMRTDRLANEGLEIIKNGRKMVVETCFKCKKRTKFLCSYKNQEEQYCEECFMDVKPGISK